MRNNSTFNDDRPIDTIQQDRLGYAEAAEKVAKTIQDFASPEGFVLGLEGNWGSGKSGLVNLIATALKNYDNAPEVIKFSPWLISSREGLLSELFRELVDATGKIELKEISSKETPEHFKWFREQYHNRKRLAARKALKSQMESFSSHLVKVGHIAKLAEFAGVSGASIVGESAVKAGEKVKSLTNNASLEEEKAALKTELRKLSRQIVIFIDDLDRLNPSEAGEIVRLIRAVTDFPNIVYVLCYSRPILAQSLSKAYSINDGEAYIEKIVQTSFSIPKPDDFDLRRMLREDIDALFPRDAQRNYVEDQNQEYYLSDVIDIEGGIFLKTPRDVSRVVNALRLYAGPVIDNVNLADITWLQIIRTNWIELYNWIEAYVHNIASISNGSYLTETLKERAISELQEILESSKDYNFNLDRFENFLPGFQMILHTSENTEEWKIFQDINHPALAGHIANKRLASPQHYKFYFAFSKPADALDDEEFHSYIQATINNKEHAINIFKDLAQADRPQGGVFAEILINRLTGSTFDQQPTSAMTGIIQSLANGMDIAAQNSPIGNNERPWVWYSGTKLFKLAWAKTPHEQRTELLVNTFQFGEALGWLSEILRSATHSLGIHGDKPASPDKQFFTHEEYSQVEKLLRERFNSIPPEELLNVPYFINLLFAWSQSSVEGKKEAEEWAEARVHSDLEFFPFLEKMLTTSKTENSRYSLLKEENLSPFLNIDKVRSILQSYANVSTSTQKSERARKLLDAIDMAKREW